MSKNKAPNDSHKALGDEMTETCASQPRLLAQHFAGQLTPGRLDVRVGQHGL